MQRLPHPGSCVHTTAPTHENPEQIPGPARSLPALHSLLLCNLGLQHCPGPSGGQGCFLTSPDKVLAPEEALEGARIGDYLAPSLLGRPR